MFTAFVCFIGGIFFSCVGFSSMPSRSGICLMTSSFVLLAISSACLPESQPTAPTMSLLSAHFCCGVVGFSSVPMFPNAVTGGVLCSSCLFSLLSVLRKLSMPFKSGRMPLTGLTISRHPNIDGFLTSNTGLS